MARGQEWLATGDGSLRRPGRTRSIEDVFVLGVTRPVWKGTGHADNNVGCIPGVARTTVASVVQSTGAVHSNLTITDKVNITFPGQKFYNCKGTYSSTGTFTGGLFQNSATSYPVDFERSEMEPATVWDRYNGFYGNNITMTRSVITKTVDGLGLYGLPANGKLYGCWIGHLSWFDDDYFVDPNGTSFPGGRANGHDDSSGTHNDGIQLGGGSGLEVIGTFFQGAKFNGRNPANVTLDSDGLGYTIAAGNGITPLDDSAGTYGFVQGSQAILAKADVMGPVTNLLVDQSWLWNWSQGILLQTGSQQGSTPMVATVTNNRFGGKWRNWGGTYRNYPLRYNTNCIVNGFQPSGAGQHYDTFGNVWDDDLDPSMTISGVPIAGQPIINRYDA